MTEPEKQYSSSVRKLLYHTDRLKHPLMPITLQIAPTDTCNLACSFCSVKNRPRDELPLPVIHSVLSHDIMRWLQGVEITGGGEPTLYPDIERMIEMCVLEFGLDVGLITNGIALMKNVARTLKLLRWARVSLNSLDYVKDVNLAGFPSHVTLGFSYVLNERTTQQTIDKVAEYQKRYDAAYVRIVPDCLDLDKQYKFGLDRDKFYVQTKAFGDLHPTAPCRMGYLKPYFYTDGCFYWCSGVCLGTRYFPKEYRMGSFREIDKIWGGQEPFNCHFEKCFWVEHNAMLRDVNTPPTHEAFV